MENNVTMRTIINEIDGDMFEGETLEFLASFLDYCNDRTTWGVPRHHCPLESYSMIYEFSILTVPVSLYAMETGFDENYLYRIEEAGSQYQVSVTPYGYNAEFDEISPAVYFPPTFDVSDPRDLEKLCNYIGVKFSPSFFE